MVVDVVGAVLVGAVLEGAEGVEGVVVVGAEGAAVGAVVVVGGVVFVVTGTTVVVVVVFGVVVAVVDATVDVVTFVTVVVVTDTGVVVTVVVDVLTERGVVVVVTVVFADTAFVVVVVGPVEVAAFVGHGDHDRDCGPDATTRSKANASGLDLFCVLPLVHRPSVYPPGAGDRRSSARERSAPATRLTQGVPWFCVPSSRRVCLVFLQVPLVARGASVLIVNRFMY